MTPAKPTLTWSDAPLEPGTLTVVVAPGGRVPALPTGRVGTYVDAGRLDGGLSVLQATLSDLRPGDELLDAGLDRLRLGLRRRLMGDLAPVPLGARTLAALQRRAEGAPVPFVWVVERAHLADPDSRGWLSRQARQMRDWSLAVVLGVAPDSPWGHGLATQARRLYGDNAVVGIVAPSTNSAPRAVEPTQAPAQPPTDTPQVAGPEAMMVLRAAATIGRSFPIHTVAELTGLAPHRVASLLQVAHDAGWHLEDAGRDTLRLHTNTVDLLRSGVPHAIAATWATRLDDLAADTPEAPAPDAPAAELPPSAPPPVDHHTVEPTVDLDTEDAPAHSGEQALATPTPPHAVDTHLERAADARQHGAWDTAAAHLSAAERLLEQSPDPHRQLALRLERAELAWRTAGEAAALSTALSWAEAVIDDATDDDLLVIAADARALAAHIAYDIGDPESLERALAHLTLAARSLEASGRPRDAAALLNDQAAVWVRLGDPVRAAHLLGASKEVFSAGSTEQDRAELAETELLLARLALHVPARSGHADAALDRAIGHARAARAHFAALDNPRQVALSRETEARLLLARGHEDDALHAFHEALTLQRHLHDVLGLARTADGLAHTLLQQGRPADAARFLADSVRFNAAAGAHRGLAYNRSTAQAIRAQTDDNTQVSALLDRWIDELPEA